MQVLDQVSQMFLGNEIQKELPGQESPFQDADPSGDKTPSRVVFYLWNHILFFLKQVCGNGREQVMLNLFEQGIHGLIHFEVCAHKDEAATLR